MQLKCDTSVLDRMPIHPSIGSCIPCKAMSPIFFMYILVFVFLILLFNLRRMCPYSLKYLNYGGQSSLCICKLILTVAGAVSPMAGTMSQAIGTMNPIIEPPMLVVGMVSPIAKPSTSIIFISKKKM